MDHSVDILGSMDISGILARYLLADCPDYFPQRYGLLCREIAQFQYPCPFDNELSNFFKEPRPSWLDPGFWLWSTFAKPVDGTHQLQKYHPTPGAKPAAIERLPNELLDMILDFLEDKKDRLALGLTSAIIWRLVLYRVHQEHESSAGMWAGKEVTFQGFQDYTGLSPAQLSHQNWLMTFYDRVVTIVQRQLTSTAVQDWMEVVYQAKSWSGISPEGWDDIEKDLSPSMYPQDRTWLLRNLTTSEYIRSDKLQPAAPQHLAYEHQSKNPHKSSKILNILRQGVVFAWNRGKKPEKTKNLLADIPFDITPLTFAQIFLVLTCQTRTAPRPEYAFHFQEGRWSGHRFDIVTIDTHTITTNASDWADVTELAVDDVANLRYWVQQLDAGLKVEQLSVPMFNRIAEERKMYHDWEGLDSQSISSKPKGRWYLKKPMQRGFLRNIH